MELSKKPSILIGALVGALITAPFIALSFLADQLAGLPFFPFDLFDWVGRNTPGDIITFVIDQMVTGIETFSLGETSSAAKTAEQLMALGMMLGLGIAVGAIFFGVLNRLNSKPNSNMIGGILGAVIGIAFVLIFNEVNNTASADDGLSQAWIVLAFSVWGVAFGWIYSDLSDFAEQSDEKEKADGNTSYQLDRRRFLINVGGATATLTVIGAGLSLLLNNDPDPVETAVIIPDAEGTPDPNAGVETVQNDLPNADASLEPAPGTRPEYTPLDNHYRIDISTRPPVIDGEEWRLNIAGLVAAPLALSLDQLMNDYDPIDQYVTISCISNRIAGSLISTTRWTGVQFNQLIEDWDLSPDATHLRITSADNFDEYVSLDLIRNDDRIMLAYMWDGQPLRERHGFPLRVYIPDHYGMKQPKWITNIEAVESWDEGYWVRRGWSRDAIVNTTSVIDTVAADSIVMQEDGSLLVPIGGIAYSGAKQISKVEVQVDDGEWQEAELREPLSELTWRIWRYDWAFEEGDHSFRVRTYDGEGVLQSLEDRGTRPDGATGVHELEHDLQPLEIPET